MLTFLWKHVKSKHFYRIVGFGIEERTMTPIVIYTRSDEQSAIWTRPCSEFFDGRFRQCEIDDEEDAVDA